MTARDPITGRFVAAPKPPSPEPVRRRVWPRVALVAVAALLIAAGIAWQVAR